MIFNIDPSNGLAVYDQIARQIKFAVAGSALRPGEMVPSVRELARSLAVNPNTVARAYRELQNEGILEAVRGTGLMITDRATTLCAEARLELIRQRLHFVLEEALRSQLTPGQIKKLVAEELAQIDLDSEEQP